VKDLHDLELVLNSATPIVVIESLEELRLLRLLSRLSLHLPHPMYQWTATDGIRALSLSTDPLPGTAEPAAALRHIKLVSRPGYYVLLDFHPYLDNPLHVRLIKEIAQTHELLPRRLLFVSHAFEIPAEVRHHTLTFDLRLPDRPALLSLIEEESQAWEARHRGRVLVIDRNAVNRLADHLLGITMTDARRIVRNAIENDGAISHSDLPGVMKAKYELMSSDGVISFEYDTTRFADIAGLGHLKAWLQHRQSAFLEAPQGGRDLPRGVMLIGVQGCGKSLAAKAVAGSFGVPLLRLDFGALYDKYIGETEKNLRKALKTAEVMSPCVLWADEIEKGIGTDDDQGLSRRVLGTLLTWMAERKARVFLVATANDIERLPPELIRKGRLDEIFFVDLPDAETRTKILSIHLRRRNLAPSGFDLTTMSATTEGFSGAEIEQAIVSALFAAEARHLSVDGQMLLREIQRTRPLSVVMAERIEYLREWARDRTVPAG